MRSYQNCNFLPLKRTEDRDCVTNRVQPLKPNIIGLACQSDSHYRVFQNSKFCAGIIPSNEKCLSTNLSVLSFPYLEWSYKQSKALQHLSISAPPQTPALPLFLNSSAPSLNSRGHMMKILSYSRDIPSSTLFFLYLEPKETQKPHGFHHNQLLSQIINSIKAESNPFFPFPHVSGKETTVELENLFLVFLTLDSRQERWTLVFSLVKIFWTKWSTARAWFVLITNNKKNKNMAQAQ